MAGVSTYLGNLLLNAALRDVAFIPPPIVYVALYSTNPTAADSGTEIVGTGYARTAAVFGPPSGGALSNTNIVLFPVAGADWGTVAFVGLRDASTSGNLLYFAPLASPEQVFSGQQFKLAAGAINVSLT